MTHIPDDQPNSVFFGEIKSVVTLVRDDNGRVLLAAPSPAGPWSCLGGRVNENESVDVAAVRIPLDDCGLSVELQGILAHLRGEKYRVIYECGQNTVWSETVFAATLVSRAPHGTAPMITEWFRPDEVNELRLDEFATAALSDLGVL